MKKITPAFMATAVARLLSCATKPAPEPEPEPKTIVESIYVDGKIFTGYVFKEILQVAITPAPDAEKITLTAENAVFNQKTTELTFTGTNWGDAQRYPDAHFTVLGTIATPAQYVLYGSAPAKPLIALRGNLLENGKDYHYDEAARLLTFDVPLDVENDSYVIHWKKSTTEIVSIVNKVEDFEEAYDALYKAWNVPEEAPSEAPATESAESAPVQEPQHD